MAADVAELMVSICFRKRWVALRSPILRLLNAAFIFSLAECATVGWTTVSAFANEYPQPSPYRIIMSQDGLLCSAVQQAYNDAYISARKLRLVHYGTSNFEAWPYPQVVHNFLSAGLQPVREEYESNSVSEIQVGHQTQLLYWWPNSGLIKASVFNDGVSHWLEFYDNMWSENAFSTEFVMFKDGLTQKAMRALVTAPYTEHLPSSLETETFNAHDPFGIGVGSENPIAKQFSPFFAFGGIGYPLTKWPNFRKLKKDWQQYSMLESTISGRTIMAPREFLPVLNGPISQRLYTFHGRIYFIARQYRKIPVSSTEQNYGGLVIVYEMKPTGPVDMCYLNSGPLGAD